MLASGWWLRQQAAAIEYLKAEDRVLRERLDRSVYRAEPAMTKPIARDPIYRRRGFDAEIIEP